MPSREAIGLLPCCPCPKHLAKIEVAVDWLIARSFMWIGAAARYRGPRFPGRRLVLVMACQRRIDRPVDGPLNAWLLLRVVTVCLFFLKEVEKD